MKHWQPESKLPGVGTSIFSVMSALAREHGAINLSQGFPDFPADPRLTSLVDKWMREGANQYAPSTGAPLLRERISELVQRTTGTYYNPDTEITVTSGGTEALFCALHSIIHPGDEVILFEPSYDSYAPAIELAGGVPVYVPLKFPGYHIPWDTVKKSVTRKTRVILLNSPHNPAGSILSHSDISELKKIITDNPIWIVSDEVYEHIVFDGLKHFSMARFPELAERSFIISSFGKSLHVTGWKLGYCIAPQLLTTEFRKVHQYVTFSTCTPMQMAISEYMEDLSYFDTLRTFYQEKRDFFRRAISGSRWKVLECSGSYFQLLGYSRITHEQDVEFAHRLTVEHKLASIPLSVFYHPATDETVKQNKVLRFCFAKSQDTLEKAAEILLKV